MEIHEIFDHAWLTFLWRFILNIVMVSIIGKYLYLSHRGGSREYLFTYIAISVVIFIVCILLNRVPVELGMVLGLFAIFSVIRFRSFPAAPLELAYLFISIGFAMLNALIPMETVFLKIMTNNLLFAITIWMADLLLFRKQPVIKLISYDRTDLLAEERREELKADLFNRYGIKGITKIQVGDIDSLKGRVKLKVHLNDPGDDHFRD